MPQDTSKTAPTPSATVSDVPDPGERTAADVSAALPGELSQVYDVLFAGHDHVVLAVSGGADSTALMHLAVAWRHLRISAATPAPNLSVVTIDHGLRRESAAETVTVADAAAALGLPHVTLVWAGPKPTTGLQAAARAARRDLLSAYLSDNNWPAVAMAHTADDQAETLLMRLARGSGVDGLGAMRPVTPLGAGQSILRPLLSVPKNTLTAYLAAHRIGWTEDPTNQSPDFERVRVRSFLDATAAHGIGLDRRALARSASRIARASHALSGLTIRAWAERGSHARFDPLGYAVLNWDWLVAQPEEIRLRLLAGLLNAIGGQADAVSLGQLEAATVGQNWHRHCLAGKTLHGAQLDCRATRSDHWTEIVITREVGRQSQEATTLAPGAAVLWDRRFRLSVDARCPVALSLRPLGCADAEGRGNRPLAPRGAWEGQPALWMGGNGGTAVLAGVPLSGFARPECAGMVHCETLLPEF